MGRRARLERRVPMSRCVLGVDVGGTSMKGALVDEDGEPVADATSRSTNAGAGADEVVRGVLDFVGILLAARGDREVAAIGLGVPGIVDERRGVAVEAVNLGWRDVPLATHIADATGLPTVVGHDVRSAAVGERLYGAARGFEDFLLIAIGTGVGAGIVIDGRPYAGSSSSGGELGHMVVDVNGPPCPCGRIGCIEAIASARAIEKRYVELARGGRRARATDLPELIDAGDEIAAQVWDAAISALALGILNYVTLLDPEAIVVGGGLASAGDRLLVPLTDAVNAGLLAFQRRRPIVVGTLGTTAGWRGAAARAWHAVSGSGG
jgi:glucokinase